MVTTEIAVFPTPKCSKRFKTVTINVKGPNTSYQHLDSLPPMPLIRKSENRCNGDRLIREIAAEDISPVFH